MTKSSLRKQKTHSVYEWLTLSIILLGAFLLRVLGQITYTFVGSSVWFRGVDPWYHIRLADAVNFPQWFKWDMFAQYPDGAAVGYMPLLAWLSINETVAAFIPPIVGSLTLVFVYLIGKELFSGKIGLVAALLVAVLPGEFLHRTLLGFTDHHVLEVFFMCSTLWLVLLAVRTQKLYYPLLAGLSLGSYLLSWAGTALFLLILGLWIWWEFLRRLSSDQDFLPLVRVISITTGIAGILSAFYVNATTLCALLLLTIGPVLLWVLSKIVKDKEKVLFGLTLVVPIGLALLNFFIDLRKVLLPIFWGGGTYIQEAAPLDLVTAFNTYGLAIFVGLAGLYFYVRNKKGNSLFLVWSLVLITATIGQRRWGYYTVVPVGLLTAYTIFYVLKWFTSYLRVAIALIIICFLLLPNVQGTIRLSTLPNNITADWNVALTWLKANSPEPFIQGEAAYYSPNRLPKRPSYGILTWWDYGHWIVRIAHRVPTESPTQIDYHASEFFTARSEAEANAILQSDLSLPYVIVHKELLEGKWHAVLQRAEEPVFVPVKDTFLSTLWNEEATTWKKIYEREEIKIFERGAK